MKSIYKIFIFCVFLILSGCEKDTNTFTYNDSEEISIEGLQSQYTLIADVDVLKIDVKANSNQQAEFEYKWGVYETSVQGYAPKIDTIGYGPSLTYPVKLNAKVWKLVLFAKNKATGLTSIVESTLNVVTQYTRGWYIAKSIGDSTDLDLYLTPNKINEVETSHNVFSKVNGHKIFGQAKQLSFFSSYKTDAVTPKSFANTRTLFVVTKENASAVYINNLKEYRNTSSLFLGSAPNGAMGSVFYSSAYYLVKGGKMFSIYNMIANNGQFGAPKMIDDVNTGYNLSDYYVAAGFSDPLFFDKASTSFVSMSQGYGPIMTKLSDQIVQGDPAKTTDIPVNNNNQNVLYMGIRAGTSSKEGYAIFQDKSDLALKRMGKITTTGNSVLIKVNTIPSTAHLYNGSNHCLVKNEESAMYFTENNKVYSYNLDNQFEQLQFDTPTDEVITFIKHQKYTESANPTYSHNYIIIGSTRGDSYKIRFFERASGALLATPSFTMEGKGMAKDVIYISPSVGETTYPSSY